MSDEDTLRRALRWAAVGEISCRIAHDSNNLLAGVLGQAELGLLSKDPARMKTALEAILRNARELKAVNERLLGFSRSVEPAQRSTNLLEVFKEIFGVLERAFAKSGIVVENRCVTGLPPTWCEPGSASHVLLFALRLALESLSAAGGGAVCLEAGEEASFLVFGVRFEPLAGTSLEHPPTRAGALTADLATSLVQEQGGSLRIEPVGRGWLVTCRFPIRRPGRVGHDRQARLANRLGAEPAKDASSILSVLVVEDEGPIRDLVKEVLEGAGCRVEAVENGEAALKSFRCGAYGVVMTDIALPGVDGVSLVRQMRALDPQAILVVLTGRATEEAVSQARAAGASVVLGKPFELSDLIGIITSVRDDPSGGGLKVAPGCPSNLLVN